MRTIDKLGRQARFLEYEIEDRPSSWQPRQFDMVDRSEPHLCCSDGDYGCEMQPTKLAVGRISFASIDKFGALRAFQYTLR